MAAKRREPIYVTLGEIAMFKSSSSLAVDSEAQTENNIVNESTPNQEQSQSSEISSEYSEEFEQMDDDYTDYEELPQEEERTPSSNTDESSESEKDNAPCPPKRPKVLGIDLYFIYYLFYVTVIQSCMKAITSVCVMSMNFNFNMDTPTCQDPECPKPVPAEKRAEYFLPCLAVFGISTFHFCAGVWLFTKHRMMTVESMKAPMVAFAVITVLEMAAIYVIPTFTDVSLGVLIASGFIIITEIISVIIAFCYPCIKPLRRRVTEEINLAPDPVHSV